MRGASHHARSVAAMTPDPTSACRTLRRDSNQRSCISSSHWPASPASLRDHLTTRHAAKAVRSYDARCRLLFRLEQAQRIEHQSCQSRGAEVLVDRFHETNRIGRMELKPTDLILRRREAPSRRMAVGSVSLLAVLRDARKSALLRTRLIDASI